MTSSLICEEPPVCRRRYVYARLRSGDVGPDRHGAKASGREDRGLLRGPSLPRPSQPSLAVRGSSCAAPLALTETGASPISSASARSASLTPVPTAPEINSGVFLAARF